MEYIRASKTVVVVGGGWAGCAAALGAAKQGCKVQLIERTDLLLGLGNVGGIMRNNGRYTAAEENIALGAGELFQLTDKLSTHSNVDFPGHRHASFYNVVKIEPAVRRLLLEKAITLRFMARVVGIVKDSSKVLGVQLSDGETIEGDVFVDATGTAGPMGNCLEYGNGCSMCILRCPAFGPRVSLTRKAGGQEYMGRRAGGAFGAMSGSCKLEKASLDEKIVHKLETEGFVQIPIPEKLIDRGKLASKVCQQYALEDFAENIILIDTGYCKMMTPFFNLEKLRTVKGFENARYVDPYAGGKGNSVRYMAVAERDKTLKVDGVDNLFAAGEKAGLLVGHTEAISTGSLADYNSGKYCNDQELLELPETTAIGKIIGDSGRIWSVENGLEKRFTFAGGEFFKEMKEKGLYSIDKDEIYNKIDKSGLKDIYNR